VKDSAGFALTALRAASVGSS